jgi:hypothetical protein
MFMSPTCVSAFNATAVVMEPVYRTGLLGGLASRLTRMALGDSSPRGRVSDTRGSPSTTPTSAAAGAEDDGVDIDEDGAAAGAGSAAAPVHVDDPRLAKEDGESMLYPVFKL